ncbi:MAG: Sec-independent protein translocase protein TatB [Rhizobiaceae bacterium]
MFDIGWTEMLVVAVVAILFVGPKELPGMLRTFGKAVKKIRMLAGDFQRQFDDALKDAELDGVKDGINQVRNLDPTKQIKDKLNPLKGELDDVKKSVEEAADYNPETLFDEAKEPQMDAPVEVDIEAALEKQREADAALAASAKLPPSSGKNAVPGFGGPPGKKSETKAKAAAKPKAKAASKTASKTASKETAKPAAKATAKAKTAKKPAAKAVAKPAAAKKPAAKSTAKPAAAKKPAAKAATKPAVKTSAKKPAAAKRKPTKKASA